MSGAIGGALGGATSGASDARTPLALIHGLLGSSGFYEPQRYLPRFEVRTPDLLGYGAKRSIDAGIDLHAQADEIVRVLREDIGRPAWLVGHSVGGAVMMLAADRAPELVAGLVSVEGNFTLKDAFWCGRIAALPEAEWAAEYGAMEDDPAAWLERSGIEAGDERIAFAREILQNQPYTTIASMAQSVLDVTGAPGYLECVRRVLARGTPLFLLGGELSASGWDIPEWVLALARASMVQPKAGHLMILEDPAAFCALLEKIVDGEVC
ncbi:alpha/beta fold hydrolase [Massilia sp. 9096]|uniref:alpha/beta fold hydrolase n=1 Tax=Massilia sp. 9096 TaxID=1500894 RepID=UPI000AF2A172|nr:alpha/beta hydrolase [Massilia sp. 9096]